MGEGGVMGLGSEAAPPPAIFLEVVSLNLQRAAPVHALRR